MGLDLNTRNAFETKNILKTFQITRKSLLELGEVPHFNHTSRIKENFYIIELLLSVVDIESYLYGMSKHYGIILPKKMPHYDPTQRAKGGTVTASLEFKLNFYFLEAKKKLKLLRVYSQPNTKQKTKKVPRAFKSEIIKFINNDFKCVSQGIKIRNKLAHGETFNALSSGKNNKKVKLSKFIREINKESLEHLVHGMYRFKEFCDISFGVVKVDDKYSGITGFSMLAALFKKNDYLALVGMRSSGNQFSLLVPIETSLAVDKELAKKPLGYEAIHSFLFVKTSAYSFINKKQKNFNGVTLKFAKSNGYNKSAKKISDEDVDKILINNYWNKLNLSKIYHLNEIVAHEMFILSLNVGGLEAAKMFQRVLNRLNALTRKKKINVNGKIDNDTIKNFIKNKKYFRDIVKSLIGEQIAFYLKKDAKNGALKMIFSLQGRLSYSSKEKTIDMEKMFNII